MNSVTDNCSIRSWTWNPAGETVNFAIELDAGPLRDPATAETEIARAVERFEKSLRALVAPPGRTDKRGKGER
ncbi:hypothetical protein JRC04_22975 [Mycolicibacterium sp. S2-37]|uniref:hypothetical protein n=1 Tax=Mycolicibacterium sp. S2-37 TaxID=2810297 RepID=UPI001A93DD4E|nr:hypothetical protein [Mycolicibacterium sp. S2-37]MBO0680339.1 hypothetical protein [Mycolicibacterium sp. S2-37]